MGVGGNVLLQCMNHKRPHKQFIFNINGRVNREVKGAM